MGEGDRSTMRLLERSWISAYRMRLYATSSQCRAERLAIQRRAQRVRLEFLGSAPLYTFLDSLPIPQLTS